MSWEIELDLSETRGAPLKERGVFRVKVMTSELYTTDNGNKRIKFQGEVADGPQKGKSVGWGLMVPSDKMDWKNKLFRTFLESLGYTPEEAKSMLSGGKSRLKNSHVEGKEGFCYYTPSQGEGTYPEVEWYSAEQAASVSRLDEGNNHVTSSDPLDQILNP